MIDRNMALVWTLYDLFNNRCLDDASGFADRNIDWIIIPFERAYHGPEGFRHYLDDWITVLSDAFVEVRTLIADEDWVVLEHNLRGTCSGAGTTLPNGQPSIRRAVDLAVCEIILIKCGKIISGRTYFDAASLTRQLGGLSQPAFVNSAKSDAPRSISQNVQGDGEVIWRLAGQLQSRYQDVAYAGVRGGPTMGQLNAARAEVYREVLVLLLQEAHGRPLAREEIASWLKEMSLKP